MSSVDTSSVEADIQWCFEIVQDVSRTFALTVSELSGAMSREICVGYLLCRVADTIEDTRQIPPAQKAALLSGYGDVLDQSSPATAAEFTSQVAPWIPDDESADWTLVSETERVINAFGTLESDSQAIIRSAVREMVAGMELFITRYAEMDGHRIQTLAELEEYCWYVAGTVSVIVTGLLSRTASRAARKELHEDAPSFGLLLQLVNVAKDVPIDYTEENNVYIPQEVLSDHGIDEASLNDPTRAAAVTPAIMEIVDEAESYLADTRSWLEHVPTTRGNTMRAWALPFLLAVATIRELRTRGDDVVKNNGLKISRQEVAAILSIPSTEIETNVAELQHRIMSDPFDQ